MSSPTIPPVAWAQRKDQLLIKVDLQDLKDEKIKLEPTKLHVEGTSQGKTYCFDLELLKEIDPEKSKFAIRGREIEFVLVKKESGPYWERLLKESGKPKWLKVDWNKWVDEDEVDEKDAFDMGGMEGFDMQSMMQGMNMPGEEGDSDDDEIPDLEEEEEEKEKKQEEEKKE